MKTCKHPLPLHLLHFDFFTPGDRMGLPYAYADGKSIDVFAVPDYFCNDETVSRIQLVFGGVLALCSLAWIRRFYLHEATGALDATIELPHSPDLAHFIRVLCRDNARNGGVWMRGTHDAYFSVLEDALNHAITARGDPERDGMIPGELDSLTNEEIERRLRAALSGERLNDLGFRLASPV